MAPTETAIVVEQGLDDLLAHPGVTPRYVEDVRLCLASIISLLSSIELLRISIILPMILSPMSVPSQDTPSRPKFMRLFAKSFDNIQFLESAGCNLVKQALRIFD